MKYMQIFTRIASLVMLVVICTSTAKAWSCPSGEHHVQTTKGTPGAVLVEGEYFICVSSTPPTTPPSTSNPVSSSSTSGANSTSTSTATSTSHSTSTSSATGGNSSATGGQVGNITTGGATSSLTGSGNSSLKNSGNSSVNNTVSASGGAGGAGGQSTSTATGGNQTQTATANGNGVGNGNNSNNYSNSTEVKAAAATAFAQAASTVSCFKGVGVGGQLVGGGFSFSGGKIDQNCAILETARSLALFGSDTGYCKLILTNKFAKQAGITMEDCLATRKVPVQVQVPVVQPVPTINVTVPVTTIPVAAVEPTPVVVARTSQKISIGECRMNGGILTNSCKRFLDDAALRLNNNPNTRLLVTGPPEASKAVVYLQNKVDPSRIGVPSFTDEANYHLVLQLEISE